MRVERKHFVFAAERTSSRILRFRLLRRLRYVQFVLLGWRGFLSVGPVEHRMGS